MEELNRGVVTSSVVEAMENGISPIKSSLLVPKKLVVSKLKEERDTIEPEMPLESAETIAFDTLLKPNEIVKLAKLHMKLDLVGKFPKKRPEFFDPKAWEKFWLTFKDHLAPICQRMRE